MRMRLILYNFLCFNFKRSGFCCFRSGTLSCNLFRSVQRELMIKYCSEIKNGYRRKRANIYLNKNYTINLFLKFLSTFDCNSFV